MKPYTLIQTIAALSLVTITIATNTHTVAGESPGLINPCEDKEALSPARWVTLSRSKECTSKNRIPSSVYLAEEQLFEAGVCVLAVERVHSMMMECGFWGEMVYRAKIPKSQVAKATAVGWKDPRRYETKEMLERKIEYEERVVSKLEMEIEFENELDELVHEKVKQGRIKRLNELKKRLKEYKN